MQSFTLQDDFAVIQGLNKSKFIEIFDSLHSGQQVKQCKCAMQKRKFSNTQQAWVCR